MLKHTFIISLILLIFTVNKKSYAQENVNLAQRYTISSKILNQDRSFDVYLPDSYSDSLERYPVLYILDSQWYFMNGVAISKSLRLPDKFPEMIVIGIQNENPLRRKLFYRDRDKFLNFFEKELIAFVDQSFRTTDERILFGWEMGAFFATYALFEQRQLFNGAILSNGALADEDIINESDQNLQSKKYLFIANSIKDIYTVQSSDNLAKLLKSKAPQHLDWNYRYFNDEVHETLAYLSLYSGLSYYYSNFATVDFSSIDEFNRLGGMSYLKDYYQKRGNRFGFPKEIHDNSKNNLIWLAWNKNDYKHFEFFMTEFQDVLKTKRYASAYWQNRFGQFYLKHKNSEKAIHYFNIGIENYQGTAEMYNGLGHAYLQNKQNELARESFQKAIDIAKENSDKNLVKYESDLNTLMDDFK